MAGKLFIRIVNYGDGNGSIYVNGVIEFMPVKGGWRRLEMCIAAYTVFRLWCTRRRFDGSLVATIATESETVNFFSPAFVVDDRC